MLYLPVGNMMSQKEPINQTKLSLENKTKIIIRVITNFFKIKIKYNFQEFNRYLFTIIYQKYRILHLNHSIKYSKNKEFQLLVVIHNQIEQLD